MTFKLNKKTEDLIGIIIISIFIGLVVGYAWCYSQSKINYELGFVDGLNEMSVLVKSEICEP